MTLGEWLDKWANVYKKPYIKESSFYRMNTVIRKHVPEDLKRISLKKLTVFDLDKAISECKMSRTRKYLYHVLSSSLKKAYKLDLVPRDFSIKMEVAKHRQKNGEALTRSEQVEFLEKIKNSAYRELFEFYLYTGCRRSEALNLQWDDIRLGDGVIRIRGTKTVSSNRIIFLTSDIADVLRRQKAKKLDKIKVFPYNKDNISHAFKRFCPTHKLHDLRHTFITRCAESGININVAQKLAGHSDIKTTLQIYTHVTTDFQRKEFEKFEL